jgi:chromosome partitioning protein
MKTIALYNIKGGVGKSVAAVNLAYLASREQKPTLLCDLDPQSSCSFYLRIKPMKDLSARSFLKDGKNIADKINGTDWPYLDFLPSNISYRRMDILLNSRKRPKKGIKKSLKPMSVEYSTVFLDCPPNISLVSENIFNAADLVLVPVIPTPLGLDSLKKLLVYFEKKNSKCCPFFSMVDRRKKMHREIAAKKSVLKTRFLKTSIPYRSIVEMMGEYHEPVVTYRPASDAALAFSALWREVKTILDRSR